MPYPEDIEAPVMPGQGWGWASSKTVNPDGTVTQNPGTMYVGGDVAAQLPPGQTQVQPGFAGPMQEPSKDVFDMLYAASVKAQAIAHKKAVEAETERLRTDMMLGATAQQLTRAQAIQRMANQQRQQQTMAMVNELIRGGMDPRRALIQTGAAQTPSQALSLAPKPAPRPPAQFSEPTTETIDGQKYEVQKNLATGQVHRRPIGLAEGAVTAKDRVAISRLNSEIKTIQANLAKLEVPPAGYMEKYAKDKKRASQVAMFQKALDQEASLKRQLAEKQAELSAYAGATVASEPEHGSDDEPREQAPAAEEFELGGFKVRKRK